MIELHRQSLKIEYTPPVHPSVQFVSTFTVGDLILTRNDPHNSDSKTFSLFTDHRAIVWEPQTSNSIKVWQLPPEVMFDYFHGIFWQHVVFRRDLSREDKARIDGLLDEAGILPFCQNQIASWAAWRAEAEALADIEHNHADSVVRTIAHNAARLAVVEHLSALDGKGLK